MRIFAVRAHGRHAAASSASRKARRSSTRGSTRRSRRAQKRVEARNFDIRKNILKYDDVMNDQRKVIFEQRIELMDAESVAETIADMRHEVIDAIVATPHPRDAPIPSSGTSTASRKARQPDLNLDLPVEDWAKEEGIDDERDPRAPDQGRRRGRRRPRRALRPRHHAPGREARSCCRRSTRSGASTW